MLKQYDTIVYIGRFQPLHYGHLKVMAQAAQLANKVVVLLGSANSARTPKNPFTVEERIGMIWPCTKNGFLGAEFIFKGLADNLYNDQAWAAEVQRNVQSEGKVALIGHKKDESSFYLDLFPQWDFIPAEVTKNLDSTSIREEFFEGQDYYEKHSRDWIINNVPVSVVEFMDSMCQTNTYNTLSKEAKMIHDYKKAWSSSPYEPTFVTADAVVVQSGHVLLVKRRAAPGKGLWALPGGFVNQKETVKAAAIRELKEETNIDVPVKVLIGNITKEKLFDNPYRSLRGRTITTAYLIDLPRGPLPKIKGSDDAEEAKWFGLAVAMDMESQMFEDHFQIIKNMI